MSFKDLGIEEIPEAVYEDIKENHKAFLDRYITPIQPSVITVVWKDFVETVEDIVKNKSSAKNLGKNCEWCSFKDLCQTELTGGDVEYVKQLYYTTPLQRNREVMEEFKKTPDCCSCQAYAASAGLIPDFDQCIEHCAKYKLYKEAKETK